MRTTRAAFPAWLRLTATLFVAGCNASAFESCWVPELSFSGGDAAAPTQTTSSYVAVAPRTPPPDPTPDEDREAARPSTPTPPLGYNRIPALPDETNARGDEQGAPTAPRAAAPAPTSVPQAAAGAFAPAGSTEGESPPPGEAPAPEVVVAPYYGGPGRRAQDVPSTVMPGVRPAAPGAQPPQSVPAQPVPAQNNPRYELPVTPVVPVAPGPQNFRVPPPPAAGPRVP